jgi:hypothetical protein
MLCHYFEFYYAESRVLFLIMLYVIMLSVIVLSLEAHLICLILIRI